MAFIFGSSSGSGGTPGGSNGQVQYNNAGAFGGFTTGGDLTLVTATGAYTLAKIAGTTLTISGLASGNILWYNGSIWQNIPPGDAGIVTSVTSSTGTLSVSFFSGAVGVDINLAHANTWTGQQTFNTSAPIFGTTTLGSVYFAGTSGLLSEDNANFFYDGTNHTLGLGTTRSGAQSSSNPTLRIKTGVVGAMQLQLQNSTGATTIDFTVTATAASIGATNSVGFGIYTVGNTQISIQPGGNTVATFNNGAGGACILQSYADSTTLQVKLLSGQVNNLQTWTNASSTVLSRVSYQGLFLAPAGSFSAPSYAVSATNSGLFLSGTNEPGLTGGGGNTGLIIKANNSLQMGVQWGGVAAVLKVIDAGAGNSNRAGTPLSIKPGEGTGNGLAGFISIYASGILGSGTTLQTNYEVVRFTTVASAANYIQATSNVSGTNPKIQAVGETNIGLTLQGSGTKGVLIGNALLPTEVTLTDGATPALDASLGNQFYLAAGGNRTIAVPSNPAAGQKIVIRHFASGGARTLALNTGAGGFRFGSDITALTATSSGKTDYIACIYNVTDSFWDVVAYIKGF